VCPKKEKREQKNTKKFLTRAGIVRDVRFADLPGLSPALADKSLAASSARRQLRQSGTNRERNFFP
jgi:hypothetical protein